MMVTTHVAAGLLLAVPVVAVAPQFTLAAAIGAILGGILPDIDLFVGTHRRTLHFPVYYSVLGVLVGAVALFAPTPVTVAAALFFLAAGLHSVSDWFGAGEELRPWERTSDRAVYLHPRRRWLRPRYLVRYDGAPEDLLLTVVFAVPAIVAFDGWLRALVVAGVLLAVAYTLFRKRVPEWLGI
ncbi:metal-dependent hydrolase [Halobellus captivus]|uniref:metal-dependent hydrolase n=1 Tax=Halobellus captivus TaxID=2592614 RepID=UPI00119F8448|nr:metal-dependent hydrolase [Halobellus captivus]